MEFDNNGHTKLRVFYDRIVDVMEELVKFTLLTWGNRTCLVCRYLECKQSLGSV